MPISDPPPPISKWITGRKQPTFEPPDPLVRIAMALERLVQMLEEAS